MFTECLLCARHHPKCSVSISSGREGNEETSSFEEKDKANPLPALRVCNRGKCEQAWPSRGESGA